MAMSISKGTLSFLEIIQTLHQFWEVKGCMVFEPLTVEISSDFFPYHAFFHAIGPEPWLAAQVQRSFPFQASYYQNLPLDTLLCHYYQVQLKPPPSSIQSICLDSLSILGIEPLANDICFIDKDWRSATLDAWGVGWQVFLNGKQVMQYLYLQEMGGLMCDPIMGILSYHLEHLAMQIQNKTQQFELIYAQQVSQNLSYSDLFYHQATEMSRYHFEFANNHTLLMHLDDCEKESYQMLEANLVQPAYALLLQVLHIFNLLNTKNAIAFTEKKRMVLRLRTLTQKIAHKILESRKALDFPLLQSNRFSL